MPNLCYHAGQYLFLLPPKFGKGIFQIIKIFEFYLNSFFPTYLVLPGSKSMLFKVDPDPGKEIEVDPDPDPDPRRGSKWIRIRIRPNVVDPGGSGSGSGSETLIKNSELTQNGLKRREIEEKKLPLGDPNPKKT